MFKMINVKMFVVLCTIKSTFGYSTHCTIHRVYDYFSTNTISRLSGLYCKSFWCKLADFNVSNEINLSQAVGFRKEIGFLRCSPGRADQPDQRFGKKGN